MEDKYKGEAVVSEIVFMQVWRVLFPHCQIRPYCSIMGKCYDCADFDYLKRTAKDPEVRKKVRELREMHRGGLFMKERAAYMRRKRYAMDHPDTVLSLIIDKMDQNHCVVPYTGTQVQLSKALKIGNY